MDHKQADGKNSLLGEFLVSLARAPEPVQEAVIMYGLRQMVPFAQNLIQPYPMMSHMLGILERQRPSEGSGSEGGSDSGGDGTSH